MSSSEYETASQFSDHSALTATSASTIPIEGSLFTCLACHVAFRSADNQRDHYRSDWHRYNLKRKVAELPPVSMENFAQRLSAQAAKSSEDAAKQGFSATCQVCRKTYSTENGYANHLASKKHREAQVAWDKAEASGVRLAKQSANSGTAAAAPTAASSSQDAAPKAQIPWRVQLASAQTEDELNAVIDSKIAASIHLDPHQDCLFCTNKSESMESNLKHMAVAHSFFVPDLEFLVDMEGLLRYLAEKISVGNVCIFCNGKGRALHTLEAVRKHMIDKGHCKVEYEDGGELELGDFYDFSSTWADDNEDDEEAEWEDMEDGETEGMEIDPSEIEDAIVARRARKRVPILSEDGMQLTLPSGKKILHKNAHVIRVPKTPLPDSLAITRSAAANYATLNAVAIRSKIATMALEREAKKQNYKVSRGYQDFRAKVGQSANKSTINQHFRSQIGFD
ncbi:C2H2 type zinc-finger-domain-containing protein [Obelidium mucronatum]|nr:C2H2 type zinc-finger-domain-containing protein [Obelidium mucronatum]